MQISKKQLFASVMANENRRQMRAVGQSRNIDSWRLKPDLARMSHNTCLFICVDLDKLVTTFCCEEVERERLAD